MLEAEQRREMAEGALIAVTGRRHRSFLYLLGRFMWQYPLGATGGVVLLFIVLVAIFAGQIAPYSPLAQDIPNGLRGPGGEFWLGTDILGRDLFSRVVFGARISLYVGLLAVSIGTVLGTLLGIASGYIGGRLDLLVQRFVDTVMGFPSLILAMVMVVGLGASVNNVTLALATTLTPRMIRISRGSALTVKEEVYIAASQAIGASTLRVMLRHVLPNSMAPVFVLATGYLGTVIVAEASLSFLGLGVPPPTPSWGALLQQGSEYLEGAPWLTIFPGVALSAVVFSFAFLGDALRDAFDPRLRGR